MKKITLTLVFLVLSISVIVAGGYQSFLNSASNTAKGNTGIAFSNGVDAIGYNSGALAFGGFDKYSLSFGLSVNMNFNTYYDSKSDYTSNSKMFPNTPFYFYVAKKFSKLFTFGIGVYSPYSYSVHWDADWKVNTIVQDFSFKTYFIQPTASFNISDIVGIGVGVIYGIGKLNYNYAIPVSWDNVKYGKSSLEGTSAGLTNFGGNIGLLFKVSKKLNIGLTYQYGMNLKFKDCDVKNTTASSLVDSFPNTKFNTAIPIPSYLGIGISYKFSEKLMLELNGRYNFWSVNDSFNISFEKKTGLQPDVKYCNNYQNTFSINVGGSYMFSEKFTFMFGAFYDLSPIKKSNLTPIQPETDQMGASLGFAYKAIKDLSIDFGLQYIMNLKVDGKYNYVNDISNSLEGTYSGSKILVSLGLSHKF